MSTDPPLSLASQLPQWAGVNPDRGTTKDPCGSGLAREGAIIFNINVD
jgi:hypothetical protein